jgi:hypothetical protein
VDNPGRGLGEEGETVSCRSRTYHTLPTTTMNDMTEVVSEPQNELTKKFTETEWAALKNLRVGFISRRTLRTHTNAHC